jgi:hypothetical protein
MENARTPPRKGLAIPHIMSVPVITLGVPDPWDAGWSPPPFSKDGRLRLIDLPIEKIIIARPHVDLSPANLTAENCQNACLDAAPLSRCKAARNWDS